MADLSNSMQTPSSRLTNVLIGKSIAETLFVGALAVFVYFTILPPVFHGWGEVLDKSIVGWAVNDADPSGRVEVHLYVDNQFIGQQVASQYRPDVKTAGWANDDWHGYIFSLPALTPGVHEARVYARHDSRKGTRKSLQMMGDPIRFTVDANGTASVTKR
jgi:hypothetical protein